MISPLLKLSTPDLKTELLEDASLAGAYEIPRLKGTDTCPKHLLRFSTFLYLTKNKEMCPTFYEDDISTYLLWNDPENYLDDLQKCCGVVAPDFTLDRNMPLVMQMWNVYRSRLLASWLERNDVRVIPNVRWGDERSYDFVFDGLPCNSTLAVGTYGCIQTFDDRKYFKLGLLEMARRLTPKRVLVYGKAPDDFFLPLKEQGIEIFVYARHK